MTDLFSLLLNIHLPSFRATWVRHPRAFSHASGFYHLDSGFLLLSGWYPLIIMCWWSLMSYSGRGTHVWSGWKFARKAWSTPTHCVRAELIFNQQFPAFYFYWLRSAYTGKNISAICQMYQLLLCLIDSSVFFFVNQKSETEQGPEHSCIFWVLINFIVCWFCVNLKNKNK